MPGFTPNLALRYPLLGEVVDATSYHNLASDIDTQMSVTDVIRQQNLHRPSVNATAASQAVTLATTTNLLFATNLWANPSTFHSTSSSTDQFVVPLAGVYFVCGTAQTVGIATATSVTVGVTQNGTAQYQASEVESGALTNLSVNAKGMVFCAAGDILRVTGRWTGTGSGNMRGSMIVWMLSQP